MWYGLHNNATRNTSSPRPATAGKQSHHKDSPLQPRAEDDEGTGSRAAGCMTLHSRIEGHAGPYPAGEQGLPDGKDGAGDVFVAPLGDPIHVVHLGPSGMILTYIEPYKE